MKRSDFRIRDRGIFPSGEWDKGLANDRPFESIAPQTVLLSECQGGGSRIRFLCEPGQRVARGEKIAEPANFTGVDLHAPVSGVVKEFIKQKMPNGELTYCVIEADETQPATADFPYMHEIVQPEAFDRAQLLAAMKDGGVCGMGGAGFPAHIKYAAEVDFDTIIVNAMECEPYLCCDHRMLIEHPYEVLNGLLAMRKACGADRMVISTEENKENAAGLLRKIIAENGLEIEVAVREDKYPQGSEKQLIKQVTGREIPSGKLPADVNVVVSNVHTARALADMLYAGEPSMTRGITVTGLVNRPGNYLVPIGTPFTDLIAAAGGLKEEDVRIVLGGPMTGSLLAMGDEADRLPGGVTKTSGGLIAIKDRGLRESPCIRCGSCASACPMGLTPYKINAAYLHGDLPLCEQLLATECIACGSCSFICPARRELTQTSIRARDEVRAMIRERSAKK